MRRDRKAESIQAATGSSHGYEMLSSESVCVHPSSGNKQVLKLHSLEESFSFQRDVRRKCRLFPCLLCRNESSRVYKVSLVPLSCYRKRCEVYVSVVVVVVVVVVGWSSYFPKRQI